MSTCAASVVENGGCSGVLNQLGIWRLALSVKYFSLGHALRSVFFAVARVILPVSLAATWFTYEHTTKMANDRSVFLFIEYSLLYKCFSLYMIVVVKLLLVFQNKKLCQ